MVVLEEEAAVAEVEEEEEEEKEEGEMSVGFAAFLTRAVNLS